MTTEEIFAQVKNILDMFGISPFMMALLLATIIVAFINRFLDRG